MLNWLGSGADVQIQTANVVEVKKLVSTLSPDDSVRAAQDAAQWLESIASSADSPTAHRYGLIELIDVPMKRHGQRLLEQYLSLKPQARFQEGLLWRSAMGYWKALGDAYLICVAQIEASSSEMTAFGDKRAQLIARAMRAHVLQIKWILMRYGYVSETYWTAAAKLYVHAEAGAFLDDAIEIYGGTHGRGSIRQEFLRTLMLGVSSTGGLSPVKQNIAERAIAHFSKAFVSSNGAMAGCNFFFDLNGGMSPARVLAKAPQGARLFYFGAGDALDALQRAVDAVNESGALPSEMNLEAGDHVDQAADTLLHLAFNWEKELPPRDSVRRKVATTLQVVHGFEGVLALGTNAGRETWVVENASAEGYGMIVPERRGEWLQVGVLIALLPEDANAKWGAGVVRRVETDAYGQRRVGVQILSRAVMPGTMCTTGPAGERGLPHNVVLLDAEPSRSGYLQVLVRPESFTHRDALEVTRISDGKSHLAMPSGMVESGSDFDRVRFKVG